MRLIHDHLKEILRTTPPEALEAKKKELQEISLGLWFYCLRVIANEYKIFNPKRSVGFIISTGSTLYSLLLDQLEIESIDAVSEEDRLIYLNSWYRFVKNNLKNLDLLIRQTGAYPEPLLLQSLEILREHYLAMNEKITHLKHAVPLEKAIDTDLKQLYAEYLQEKGCIDPTKTDDMNQDRLFFAQLAVAIGSLASTHELIGKNNCEIDTLPTSELIKLGAVLYMMHSIEKEYLFRSGSSSKLHELFKRIMNGNDLSKIDPNTRLVAYVFFSNFLTNPQALDALETFGRENFGDKHLLKKTNKNIYIFKTHHLLRNEIDALFAPGVLDGLPGVKYVGLVGAIAAAAPGYGTGMMAGNIASKTNSAVPFTLTLGNGLNTVGVAIFGKLGNCLGVFVADHLIQNILERAFGKVLEAVFMVGGFAVGGLVGYVAVDLTARGLKAVYDNYKNNPSRMSDPTLIQQTDPRFIECLFNLPEEIMSDKEKKNLDKITIGYKELNLFQREAVKVNFDQPARLAIEDKNALSH